MSQHDGRFPGRKACPGSRLPPREPMTATRQSAPDPGWWRFVPMAGWIRRYEPVHDVLARDGVLDRIGAENIHGNVDHAVTAQLATEGDSHADL
jgi:hypothetical protein